MENNDDNINEIGGSNNISNNASNNGNNINNENNIGDDGGINAKQDNDQFYGDNN